MTYTLSMILVGRLIGKIDVRLLILCGMCLLATSQWQMSGFSLEMDQRPIVVSGLVQGFALGFVFVPLNTIAFGTIDPKFPTSAASLLNLCRNLGGAIGISAVTLLLARNLQISHSDLASHITQSSLPPVSPAITQGTPQITETAAAMMDAEINRQALMIAYIDDFYLMMIVCVAAIPLLLLLRKGRVGVAPPISD